MLSSLFSEKTQLKLQAGLVRTAAAHAPSFADASTQTLMHDQP